ncbi:MAG: phospholipase effector Tle1 domain-containing protein, partial [Flavobacteriales bacterium]
AHSHPSREVHCVGVFDTVGAMGIPITFLGLFEKKDEFYDNKIGKNVKYARHALALDELRVDFKPTVWDSATAVDMKQVWFAGAHSDIGGGTEPDADGCLLSNNSLSWMIKEMSEIGLTVENHLEEDVQEAPLACVNHSRTGFYRVKKKYFRPLDRKGIKVQVHTSVKKRWDAFPKYRPKKLASYVKANGWPALFS